MPEAIRLPGYSNRYVSYMSTAMTNRNLAGISVPHSPLIEIAVQLAQEHLSDWAYNHAMRSWLFGTVIADRHPNLANRDREVHALAAILHHLGLGEDGSLVSDDKCFEVDSANAARVFIERQPHAMGWNGRQKQLLWDCIALHTCPHIALHKEPEVISTVLGVLTDFRGPSGVPGARLTEAEWQSVVNAYPRSGLRDGLVQKMCEICRSKPETTYNAFAGDFGEELVEGYSRSNHREYGFINNDNDD